MTNKFNSLLVIEMKKSRKKFYIISSSISIFFIIVLMIIVLFVKCPKVEILCPAEVLPANGYINEGNYSVGQNVTFVCSRGYKMLMNNESIESQNTTLYCDENGKWTGQMPRCQVISCPVPKAPDNGKIIGSDFIFGKNVTFECLFGYELNRTSGINELVETPMLYCDVNGDWIGQIPICQKL